MPRPGLRIHFHAVPVTMKLKAIGYRYTVRNSPSARIFWSSRMASSSPSAIAPPMKRMPKIARLVSATHQRSLANSVAYWAKPANS